MERMNASVETKRSTPPRVHPIPQGPILRDLPIEEAVAYLMETYDLDDADAREKVLVAKGRITRDSHAIDE